MSKRGQILDAVAALLETAAGINGRSYRSRVLALKKDKLPAIIVRPVSESVTEPTNAGADRLLTVAVEIQARGDVVDSIMEPIGASAVALVLADATLGGLAIDVGEIGSEWLLDDGDGDAGSLTINFAILYRTARTAT